MKILKSLNLDNIPNEILKNKEVIRWLLYLHRKCCIEGVVSSIWLDDFIIPIPKSKSQRFLFVVHNLQIILFHNK